MSTPLEVFTGYVKSVGGREEAARRLGVSVALIGHILTGRREISPKVATAVETDTAGFIKCDALKPDTRFTRNEAGHVTGYHVSVGA